MVGEFSPSHGELVDVAVNALAAWHQLIHRETVKIHFLFFSAYE